ncbi:MAG: fumarate hydratase [Deltaproteobacteria bacterium]|nr:fumarate hydratase [Deltaproteobacteria bacterium]
MPATKQLHESLVEIIHKTATELPEDVSRTIEEKTPQEASRTKGAYAMETIKANMELARSQKLPVCRDCVSLFFAVDCPRKFDEEGFGKEIRKAVVKATRAGYLPQSSMDTLTGGMAHNNLGPGMPTMVFHQSHRKDISVRLIMKGSACENMGAQYLLPDTKLGTSADLEGAKKCILDALTRAQSAGCGPGVIGVGIGGDRLSSYLCAREQFLRKLTDINPVTPLARLEQDIVNSSNQLGIGPLGFGGKTALLGCKIGALNRLPHSYFVSISYMCWTCRRHGAVLDGRGKIKKWLY